MTDLLLSKVYTVQSIPSPRSGVIDDCDELNSHSLGKNRAKYKCMHNTIVERGRNEVDVMHLCASQVLVHRCMEVSGYNYTRCHEDRCYSAV